MTVTRLKRKDRKNKARANNKQRRIKQLLATPVIKNVDIEALKAQFTTATPAPVAATETSAIAAPATEPVAVTTTEPTTEANPAPETASAVTTPEAPVE